MLGVDQRETYDCLRCAIASLFNLTYGEVPQFGEGGTPDETEGRGWAQETEFNEWLAKRSLGFLRLPNPWAALEAGRQGARLPWGLCLGEGKSPRGDWDHTVVVDARGASTEDDLSVVHDPHPDRTGLRGRIESFVCFTVEDPGEL